LEGDTRNFTKYFLDVGVIECAEAFRTKELRGARDLLGIFDRSYDRDFLNAGACWLEVLLVLGKTKPATHGKEEHGCPRRW
jgi:hypothetical protein